jgi:hypothetical protein
MLGRGRRRGGTAPGAGEADRAADLRAAAVIVAVILVANAPYLSGRFVADPLGPISRLGLSLPGTLSGQPTLDSNVGNVSQTLGHLAATDLVHLRLPWWNPYEATGAPLAGEMQAGAFFPPTLLTLLANGQLFEHILFELVAGLSTYALVRRLGTGRGAATVAGVAFGLNGTFAWLGNAVVNPIGLLPLILLGVEHAHAAARAGRGGGWWLLGCAGALSVLAGFPEVAYLGVWLAGAWALWRAIGLRGRLLTGFAVKLLAGGGVAALLSAPLLIAFGDYLAHADLWAHAGAALSHVHLVPLSRPQLLLPYLYGPPDAPGMGAATLFIWGLAGGYLTTSLLFLGLSGLLLARRPGGLRWLLAVWVLVSASAIYGLPLVDEVLPALPGMSHVEVARYAFSSLELAACVLAGLGAEELIRRADVRRRLVLAASAAVLVVAIALTSAGHRLAGWFPATVSWGVLAVLALAATGLWMPVGRPRARAILAIVAVDVAVMFAIPELSAPRAVRLDTAPVAFLRRHLGEQRFFSLGPLAPNYGTYFGLGSLDEMDVPVSTSFSRYVRTRLDPGSDPTAFDGGLVLRPAGIPGPVAQLVRRAGSYRAAAVSYVLTDPGLVLPASAGFDLRRRTATTWIYSLAGAEPYLGTPGAPCRVRSRDRATAVLSCPVRATLVRRETDLPGWTAAVDGRPAAIRPVNGIFQAVEVPAGRHRVSFSFTPPHEGWGLAALLVGLAALASAPLAARRGLYRAEASTSRSASATRATWPSVIPGKNGSAIERAATSSQTGNSPGRWPKRSR